jgi:toxin ParE1/3/4
MPPNKKFHIRPKADKDLVNIYEYSYQEFGDARADQYIRDLDAAFHKLADEPSLGSDYSHVRPGLMAYRVVSHVVFFRPSVYGITILRVLHKSMDYGRHL